MKPRSSGLCVEVLEDRTVPSFLPPVTSSIGAHVTVSAGDFNNDGLADLVALDGVSLGNGDGTFQAPRSPITGLSGDFNGDGKLDLATNAAVHLGNGDGTFQTGLPYSLPRGQRVIPLAAGDVNGDGRDDLVVEGQTQKCTHRPIPFGGSICFSQSFINVLLARNDGSLRTRTSFEDSRSILSELGDFNGDGNLDIVNPARLYLGKGDGTFQTAVTVTGLSGDIVAVADLNGDGKSDLITANFANRTESVALSNGDGSFRTAQTSAPYTYVVLLGDFNRDGKPDLVTRDETEVISIFLGNGDGTFQPGQSIAAFGPQVVVVALHAGDFDGDGWLDLAVGWCIALEPCTVFDPLTVSVLLNGRSW